MIANLESIFVWALRASLEALPLALVALAFARCRSCQAQWRIWLLALFFLRLAVPVVPEVTWRPSGWPKQSARAVEPKTDASDAALIPHSGAITTRAVDWQSVAARAWLCGVMTVGVWLIASHLRLRRRIVGLAEPAPRWLLALANWACERQGVSRAVRVEVMPGASTLAVFGWWRPRLLVPADVEGRYTGEQIRGMLLHEIAHVRRHDILWNWAALALCAIHWFNPLAWVAFRRFCVERELLCDASAVACLNEEGRRSYGEALLRSLRIVPMPGAPSLAPFFRVHPEIEQRLLMITKPVPTTLWSRLGAALVIPALSLIVFTTSRGQSDTNPLPKPTPEAAEAAAREREKGAVSVEGERGKRSAERDGEGRKAGPRDGEAKKEGARDGDGKREGARDGDRSKSAAREGERPRRRGKDGEMKRGAAREGDGEGRRSAAREGERAKTNERDGDRPRTAGERDGEGRKAGPRDGEQVKSGPRDGEGGARKGPRDGEKTREGERSREGDSRN